MTRRMDKRVRPAVSPLAIMLIARNCARSGLKAEADTLRRAAREMQREAEKKESRRLRRQADEAIRQSLRPRY